MNQFKLVRTCTYPYPVGSLPLGVPKRQSIEQDSCEYNIFFTSTLTTCHLWALRLVML
jgi:hypothetical protein